MGEDTLGLFDEDAGVRVGLELLLDQIYGRTAPLLEQRDRSGIGQYLDKRPVRRGEHSGAGAEEVEDSTDSVIDLQRVGREGVESFSQRHSAEFRPFFAVLRDIGNRYRNADAQAVNTRALVHSGLRAAYERNLSTRRGNQVKHRHRPSNVHKSAIDSFVYA
jgi:hypothetical protein